jgi:hypothetical protein
VNYKNIKTRQNGYKSTFMAVFKIDNYRFIRFKIGQNFLIYPLNKLTKSHTLFSLTTQKKQPPEIFRKLYAIHLTTKIVYFKKPIAKYWLPKNPLKGKNLTKAFFTFFA